MPEKCTHTDKQCLKIGEERRAKRSDVQGEVSRETVWLRECRETAEGIEWQNKCRIGELEKISPDLEKLDTRRANKWLDLTESQVVKDLKGRHKYKQGFFFWRDTRKGENLLGYLCFLPPDGMLQWASLGAMGDNALSRQAEVNSLTTDFFPGQFSQMPLSWIMQRRQSKPLQDTVLCLGLTL